MATHPDKVPLIAMSSPAEAELDPPFEILEPAECRSPVVFNSPHSGRIYPRAFLDIGQARPRDAAPLGGLASSTT